MAEGLTYRPKRCEYNNEYNSPNILSDKIVKLHLRNLDMSRFW